MIFGDANTSQTVKQTTDILERTSNTLFDPYSIIVFFVALGGALLAGRIVASLLRKLVLWIGRQADKNSDLKAVNKLRRIETMIVLSIALIRTFLVGFALYIWWQLVHPTGSPTAVIGASAFAAIIVGGALGPALRDFAAGAYMMTEQWYGVGDHIKVEPFGDIQGVVERVTLRSTRIRGLNGEIIWLNNQNIAGIRLAPRGIRTIALEMFVSDAVAGEKLIERANRRLPIGSLLVVSPLAITSCEKVGDSLWHITAIGDTAPGREWLLEKTAVEVIKELDEQTKKPVLAYDPLARFADTEAEQRFRRSIQNARKRPKPKKSPIKAAAAKAKSKRKSS